MLDIKFTYMKTPLRKYTFENSRIRGWVNSHCASKRVLNLFAGKTLLSDCDEVRNDIDITMVADHHMDALDFVREWTADPFDIVVLDPPYSYRKSMEFYNGHKASRFNQMKDILHRVLCDNGKVITFGYHSVSLGLSRGYVQEEILLMSHGGAIHDTIAVVEVFTNNSSKSD